MARTPPVAMRVDDRGSITVIKRELARLGDKELKKAFYKGLNEATKPMRRNAQEEAARRLPRRGGLNARVAKERLSTSSSRGGVAIVGPRRKQLKRIDEGFVRHPVFGNREVWVTQRVTPGYFTEPMLAGEKTARRDVIAHLDQVAREIAKKTSNT